MDEYDKDTEQEEKYDIYFTWKVQSSFVNVDCGCKFSQNICTC
jgi:hypothetical protein